MVQSNFLILGTGIFLFSVLFSASPINQSYLAFAESDFMSSMSKNMEKNNEHYLRILCMGMPATFDLEPCNDLPVNEYPEFSGHSDAQVLKEFLLFTYQSTKQLEEQPLFDINYLSLPEEEMIQKAEDDAVRMNEIVVELGRGMSELEFRGFAFSPIQYFDEDCNLISDLSIGEPILELPKNSASEFEIVTWILEYDEKLNQYYITLNWKLGKDLENINPEDKQVLSKFKASIENLNNAVIDFKENKNSENIQVIREALKEIENIPENPNEEMILSVVDLNDDGSEILIETSLESIDYFEPQLNNSDCLESSKLSNFGSLEQTQQQNSQMDSPLQFVEYSIDSIPSPHEQVELGVFSNSVMCTEGKELLMRPNLDSSVCVKSSSLEKLLERGWMLPDIA